MRTGRPDAPFSGSDTVDPRRRGTHRRPGTHGRLLSCHNLPRHGTATTGPRTSVTWSTAIGDLRASLWSSADGRTGTLRTRLESQLDAASTVLTAATNRLDALPDDSPSGGPAAVSTPDRQTE
jgi:hypothetical protein